MRELRAGSEYQCKQAAVDELWNAAEDLERQAEELRRQAKTMTSELRAWEAAKLAEQHGPIQPFIETAEYDR